VAVETLTLALALLGTVCNVGILTAIYFRMGQGSARIEELFRRVLALEERFFLNLKGENA
jgi:hypothetical protein